MHAAPSNILLTSKSIYNFLGFLQPEKSSRLLLGILLRVVVGMYLPTPRSTPQPQLLEMRIQTYFLYLVYVGREARLQKKGGLEGEVGRPVITSMK